MAKLEIDLEKCNGCGDCIDVCPASVFGLTGDKPKVVNLDDCIECCACIDICEPEAVTHEDC